MKTTIKVTITDIEIDDYYYSFWYSITVDGKHIAKGYYSGDHSWRDDKKGFERVLKSGEAVKLALEQEL